MQFLVMHIENRRIKYAKHLLIAAMKQRCFDLTTSIKYQLGESVQLTFHFFPHSKKLLPYYNKIFDQERIDSSKQLFSMR